MSHTCNPSYSGRRDQSGGSQFEASSGKLFAKLHLEKKHHQNGLVEWLKV
jgi:hypothetical protein